MKEPSAKKIDLSRLIYCIEYGNTAAQYYAMDDDYYWLILANAAGIGPVTSTRLLDKLGSAKNICIANHADLQTCGLKADAIRALKEPNTQRIEQQIRWANQDGHYLLPRTHSDYPPLLMSIPDPPVVLFVKGNPTVLSQPQLAMVGSRHPSYQGREIASWFAAQLSQAGWVVTSGLALGIDGACHQGVLRVSGMTIAILGSGLSQVYPHRHRDLADQIVINGALVSEFPLDAAPLAKHFPQRNRLISGLSLGTCVIEATLKSGSLITARLAAEQGREVFAVPGSIRNPLTQGCHTLIQDGAKLVTDVSDVLAEFEQNKVNCSIMEDNISMPALDPGSRQLLECVEFDVTATDQLVQRSGWPAQQVAAQLMALVLKGYVRVVPGGYVRIQ